MKSESQFWAMTTPPPPRPNDGLPYSSERRAAFADPMAGDVVPVTENSVTRASVPGKTFQVRPKVEEADGKIVQTPYIQGLPVGLFDGSVRTLSPRISESVFWGLVTPDGKEVLGDF